MERDPKAALALAQEACKLAPTLVPAAAISGKLMAQAGDYRRATRTLEAAYTQTPHPDLAAAYLHVRHGDSTEDRLSRARALARMAPNDPESLLTVGRAALEAHDGAAARAAIAPLIASDSPSGRPTRRVCLLMADIEEAEGNHGAVREWLGRAARAPRDKAWVADGVISDRWAPVSPSGDARRLRLAHARRAHRGPGGELHRSPPAPQPPAAAIAAPAPARCLCAGGDRASAAFGACAGANPRSRAANRRHHRSRIDGARRPGPSRARSQTARLPALRQ